MVKGYSGMRKGVTLVEMMVAVILFGVIAVVGYNYYKNFYNTKLAGKQARAAALIEQGAQLSNAWDIYESKAGIAPTDETNLTQGNMMILTSLPAGIKEMTQSSAVAWDVNLTAEIGGNTAGANDHILIYPFNTGSQASNLEYCNIINNYANPTLELNASSVSTTATAAYGATGNANVFCFGVDATASTMAYAVFIKKLI